MAFIGVLFSLFIIAFIFTGFPAIGLFLIKKVENHDNRIIRIITKFIGYILMVPAILILLLLLGSLLDTIF